MLAVNLKALRGGRAREGREVNRSSGWSLLLVFLSFLYVHQGVFKENVLVQAMTGAEQCLVIGEGVA